MMKVISEKTIDTILQEDPQSILAFIQKKVTALKKLNQIWITSISPELVPHSRVANFRDNILIIETASAAWATRLRYVIPELSKKLAEHPELKDLGHIEWYIQPNYFPPPQTAALQPILSNTAARLLQTTAEDIKTESLKAALLRLSTRKHIPLIEN